MKQTSPVSYVHFPKDSILKLSTTTTAATHLTPGGGVPVETGLNVTGYLGLRPGGHGPAVERSEGPLIPHVKTLDLSGFNAAFTVLGALGNYMDDS